MSLIDLFSILPYYLMLVMPKNDDWSSDNGAFALLRVFRVFRILKFARHSQSLKVIGLTLKSSFNYQFGLMLAGFSMAVIIFSTIIYYVENFFSDDPTFTSIPQAFWYSIITMTNVG